MKVREVLDRLKRDGWMLIKTVGSHRQFIHPTKPGKVTVNRKPNDDVGMNDLRSIFRQAGWDWADRG